LPAAALGVAGLAGLGQVTGAGAGGGQAVQFAVVAGSFGAMGMLVLLRLSRHPVGALMTGAGVAATAELLALSWSRWLPAAWLSQWAWWPPFALIFIALALFPDGRPPVIARLGELLGRSADVGTLLSRLTATLGRSLQVPYVAVELIEAAGVRRAAQFGDEVPGLERFPMLAYGDQVGALLVAPRTAGSRFTRRERLLLTDVATQAAVAAESTRLMRELRHSREQLIIAREEERRRIRRDLHDGLGPALTGMSMQVSAVRKVIDGPDRAVALLGELLRDLRVCRLEVRHLVDDLRPPALDRGLEPALRAQCERLCGEVLAIELVVTGPLADLPAALEVAAYRIVTEALTNVVRHAQAASCRVTVCRASWLSLCVDDDGVGVGPAADSGGVGLGSIRERAVEIGGDCEIGRRPGGGTAVRVRLPITPVPQVDAR